MNYEKDTNINELALEIEWLNQPALMLKYAHHRADLENTMDRLQEKLTIVKAELDKEIRSNPTLFGIEKLTESAVSNTIILQDAYKAIQQEILDARYELNYAKGAVHAIDGKKTSLENLVKLHGQQYFAGPSIPRTMDEVKAERQKSVDTNVASVMRKRLY